MNVRFEVVPANVEKRSFQLYHAQKNITPLKRCTLRALIENNSLLSNTDAIEPRSREQANT